jgi:uncharacterized protein YraI
MRQRFSISIPAFMLVLLLFGSACAPLAVPRLPLPASTPAPASEAEATANTELPEDSATATVNTRSLRVRNQPSETAEVIAGIEEGERFQVLGISSDGLWVELAINDAPGGSGWVSASFVSVEGPITDVATTEVPTATALLTETAGVTTPVTTTVTTTATVLAPPAPGFAQVRTDGTRLRVRAEPSTEAAIVGYVYNGESYPALEVSTDGQWVFIGPSTDSVTDNPSGGWVAAEFVLVGE